MFPLIVFAAAVVGAFLVGHRFAARRIGTDYANRQWTKVVVVGVIALTTGILVRRFAGPLSLGNLELPLLVLGTGVEFGALVRHRWNRARFGEAVANMAGSPIHKVLRMGGVLMLGSAGLMMTGLLIEGQTGTMDLLRIVFFGATGLLLLVKSRPTPELFERGIVRLEGTLSWERVSAYAWQEYEKLSVLRLQLREPWRFQRRLSFAIPASEHATVHAWLQKRLPYLGSARHIRGDMAKLTD